MNNDTLNLETAAEFLQLSPGELRRRARLGQLKAIKPGKRWVFLKSDLVDYLEDLYASSRQAIVSDKENTLCHYEIATARGGLTSNPPVENAYENLLGLRTKR